MSEIHFACLFESVHMLRFNSVHFKVFECPFHPAGEQKMKKSIVNKQCWWENHSQEMINWIKIMKFILSAVATGATVAMSG